MGNVASVGLIKETDFTTTKSQLDFITNEIKSDSGSYQEIVETSLIQRNADYNIIKKLSADCSDFKETEATRCNSSSDSGSVIPSLLSFIGLNGPEDTTLLHAVNAPTKMDMVQSVCDGADKLADIMSESKIMKPRNKRMTLQSSGAMPLPARKNGYVAQVEENNLCVFNFMWVCSYGSFTAVPRAYNRLSLHRSVPPPRSPLMKAVKGLPLSMNQIATQSALTRITALSRRNPANAYRNRHQRRTQLQAPLHAAATVLAKGKSGQNSREMQIVDSAVTRNAQAEGVSNTETIDANNNDNEHENNENSSGSSNINTKNNIRNHGINNNGCGNKGNGKSKVALVAVPTAMSATVSSIGRKAPPFAQQPPQKFTLGHPRNRKYRPPTTLPPQKSTTTKRPKSHTISHVEVTTQKE